MLWRAHTGLGVENQWGYKETTLVWMVREGLSEKLVSKMRPTWARASQVKI